MRSYDFIKCGVCGCAWTDHETVGKKLGCTRVKPENVHVDPEYVRASDVNLGRKPDIAKSAPIPNVIQVTDRNNVARLEKNSRNGAYEASPSLNAHEALPVDSGNLPCWPRAIEEFRKNYNNEDIVKLFEERDVIGTAKYGVPLMPFNGRDCAVDLLQELLDAYIYNTQKIMELESQSWDDKSIKEINDLHIYEKLYLDLQKNIVRVFNLITY